MPAAQAQPFSLLDVWFQLATQMCGGPSAVLLGAWVRVWINNGRDVVALALCRRDWMDFLTPICPLCTNVWNYRGAFSHIGWMPLCQQRIVRANVCSRCEYAHRVIQPFPVVNGQPQTMFSRQHSGWYSACYRCGAQNTDATTHLMYFCVFGARLFEQPTRDSDSSSDSDAEVDRLVGVLRLRDCLAQARELNIALDPELEARARAHILSQQSRGSLAQGLFRHAAGSESEPVSETEAP